MWGENAGENGVEGGQISSFHPGATLAVVKGDRVRVFLSIRIIYSTLSSGRKAGPQPLAFSLSAKKKQSKENSQKMRADPAWSHLYPPRGEGDGSI
jgi:hypothetical protein